MRDATGLASWLLAIGRAGVLHSVEALEYSRVVEVRAPPPDLESVLRVSTG